MRVPRPRASTIARAVVMEAYLTLERTYEARSRGMEIAQ